MTVSLSHLRARVATVERDLEPCDHIVAETLGETGRVPWWEVPAGYVAYAIAACGLLAAGAFLIAGKQAEAGLVGVCLAPSCLVSFVAPHRTPTCIVATKQRVYLIPLPTSHLGRARAITRTPVACLRVSAVQAGRFRHVIRLDGPTLPMEGVQFLVTGAWRADLDSLLVAISTGRDPVEPPPAIAASQDLRS